MNKIQTMESIISSIAKKLNVEIVDIQYVRENGVLVVRIFIDKPGGVAINDCENINHIFGEILDASDLFKNSYILEISSPGPNRALKKEESFKRFIGNVVKIQTFQTINNQRNFFGRLLDFKDSKIKINDVTNGILEIEFLNIKKANIATDYLGG
jgi:ribosome maturation factor RimP